MMLLKICCLIYLPKKLTVCMRKLSVKAITKIIQITNRSVKRAVLLYAISKNSIKLRIKHFITDSNVDYRVLFIAIERW